MPLIFVDKNACLVEVRAATFPIGTVSLVMRSAGGLKSVPSRWHLTVSASPPGFNRDGHAYSLEDAKSAIEEAWQTWLAAAGLTEKAAQHAEAS